MEPQNKELRFVFVVGGVLSGLGKGIVTASVARLIKDSGYNVTAIKIDPYVNIDAGTMRPTEHGEVFVTEDGGEIDQDFGTYERFLDINIPKNNNITTGKVYSSVIKKERALEYGGKDVKLIPDIVNEIKEMILKGSEGFDVSVVEVGGTTGDIENLVFLYAIRDLMQEYQSSTIMVSYVPLLKNVGELKTKPTQHAMAKIRETGIVPDFIVVRSEQGMDKPRLDKIATSCFLPKENIIDDPDVSNIYEMPLIFEKQNFVSKILKNIELDYKKDAEKWRNFVEKVKKATKEVKIGIVGKYVAFGDSEHKDVYVSVMEAIKHAAYNSNLKPVIKQVFSTDIEKKGEEILSEFDGIIVPGGFGSTGVEGKIEAIKYCRENNIPFLGLCFGMQLAVVEYARNVCGLDGAHSTEIDPNTKFPVIDILPEQKELIKQKRYGATMRLGGQEISIKEHTLAHKLYGKDRVIERFRHRYEVNPKYVNILERGGLIFSGSTPDGKIKQMLELPKNNFFVGTQAHPEFTSRVLRPNPLFVGFVEDCHKSFLG